MKKLRLLLFKECNRSCAGCCNKDWNLNALPINKGYKNYKEIILTGGEPLLNIPLITKVCNDIWNQTDCPIYLYTAKGDNLKELVTVIIYLDGITLTLHEQSDVEGFIKFNKFLLKADLKKSLRLNVFEGIVLPDVDLSMWNVKENIKWMKDCPLPKDEVFKRYS